MLSTPIFPDQNYRVPRKILQDSQSPVGIKNLRQHQQNLLKNSVEVQQQVCLGICSEEAVFECLNKDKRRNL